MKALTNRTFWTAFLITAVTLCGFFAWELGYFKGILPSLPRAAPTNGEFWFTVLLILLLSFDVGLLFYRSKHGTCPPGAKRATKISGAIGAVTLLCPACLLIPISFLGISLSLTFLAPFLPLLRIIAILLLSVSAVMLWPKN